MVKNPKGLLNDTFCYPFGTPKGGSRYIYICIYIYIIYMKIIYIYIYLYIWMYKHAIVGWSFEGNRTRSFQVTFQHRSERMDGGETTPKFGGWKGHDPWPIHGIGTSIFTYVWLIFMVHVRWYTTHGSYGFGSWKVGLDSYGPMKFKAGNVLPFISVPSNMVDFYGKCYNMLTSGRGVRFRWRSSWINMQFRDGFFQDV